MLTLPAREHASNTVGAGRDSPPPAAVARPAEPGTSAIPATQPPLHQVQHCCGTRQWRCSSGKIPGRRQPAPPWTPSPPGTIHSGPPNPTLHLMQLGLELEPGHQPTAAPSPPAPPRREARDELKPSAAFRVAARRTQLRRPRPGPVSDLDPDDAAPGPDRDRDRLPGSTRAGVPNTVTEDLADQQEGHVPRTGAPGRAPQRRRHGRPAPAPAARQASRSPGPLPQSLVRTRLPDRPGPGKSRGPPGGHTGMDARLGGKRQGQGTPGTGTGTPVKRLPTPLPGPDSRPPCVRGHRNTTPYSATR